MSARLAPAALTAAHIGSGVVAEESAGQIAGVLSDVQQCAAGAKAVGHFHPLIHQVLTDLAVVTTLCPLTKPRPDAHTHLWLGGQTQVVSHAAGRIYITASAVPTDRPGGTS